MAFFPYPVPEAKPGTAEMEDLFSPEKEKGPA